METSFGWVWGTLLPVVRHLKADSDLGRQAKTSRLESFSFDSSWTSLHVCLGMLESKAANLRSGKKKKKGFGDLCCFFF